MNYTEKQIRDFTEITAEYIAGGMDFDECMEEIGVKKYEENTGITRAIEEMHLSSEEFDYNKGEEIMNDFNIVF